jgi:hypothetical protein
MVTNLLNARVSDPDSTLRSGKEIFSYP